MFVFAKRYPFCLLDVDKNTPDLSIFRKAERWNLLWQDISDCSNMTADIQIDQSLKLPLLSHSNKLLKYACNDRDRRARFSDVALMTGEKVRSVYSFCFLLFSSNEALTKQRAQVQTLGSTQNPNMSGNWID